MKLKLHEGAYESGKRYFWFTYNAKNGQVLLTSETYVKRGNALKSMRQIQKITPGLKAFEKVKEI